jgi:hypothetical protein
MSYKPCNALITPKQITVHTLHHINAKLQYQTLVANNVVLSNVTELNAYVFPTTGTNA